MSFSLEVVEGGKFTLFLSIGNRCWSFGNGFFKEEEGRHCFPSNNTIVIVKNYLNGWLQSQEERRML